MRVWNKRLRKRWSKTPDRGTALYPLSSWRSLRRVGLAQVFPRDSSTDLSIPQVNKAAQQETRPGGPPESPLLLQFVQVQPWTWVLRKWAATRPQGSRVARLRADLVEYAIPI